MTKTILAALTHHCRRCEHTWLRRAAYDPRQCPKCKTKFWNKPRVRKIKPERLAESRGEAKAPAGTGTDRDQPSHHDRRPGTGSGPVRANAAKRANRKGTTRG